MQRESRGNNVTIAYAALHQRLRYRGEDTGLYAVSLDDERLFVSRQQPRLYDRQAQRMSVRELLPGSFVKVKFSTERGVNLMNAVQLIREPALDFPFDPVPDDGHL